MRRDGRKTPLLIAALCLLAIVLAFILPWLLPAATQGYWLSLATRALIFALAALSLDLVLGLGGMVSFGHAAFLGIGAYAAGIMVSLGHAMYVLLGAYAVAIPASHGITSGFTQLAIAISSTALLAAGVGAVSLRTTGIAFIMITLAFGQMAFFGAQALYAYGGDDGLTLPMRSTLAGHAWLKDRANFYHAVLAMLVLVYLGLRWLKASRFGQVLQAARENPVRVGSLGYDVTRVKLTAYVISGALCALAGFLLANQSQFVSPAFLSWQRSGELIFMVILGGAGSLHGAILGAIAFLMMEEWLSGLTENWKVIFGPLIILFVLLTRGGIVGLFSKLTGRTP